ncbi:MAG: hypothetical protein C0622_07800 [Desulfuromonas sp.]|nr:MAG: hypothetical protein C0622_07800 [Desulfuromonas sp.]
MLTLHYRENDITTANLHLKGKRTAREENRQSYAICITRPVDQERPRVERFIQEIFRKSYNAEISVDYPCLMSLRNADGEILAALGFRYAGGGPLFLERYTEKPLEQILNCPRSEIVEIGNLASSGQGSLNLLFAALASYLLNKNILYAAITGTDFLHRHFARMGFAPRRICDAAISAVQGEGQNWGSYYDTQPRVLAGSLEMAVARFKTLLGAEFDDCRPRLFPRFQFRPEVAAA